jgi:hypothetical protein
VNTSQAGSPGPLLVKNDPKLVFLPKITPQLPVRGLNEIFSMREPAILNSNKKTTSSHNNINDNINNNDNINEENNEDTTQTEGNYENESSQRLKSSH